MPSLMAQLVIFVDNFCESCLKCDLYPGTVVAGILAAFASKILLQEIGAA